MASLREIASAAMANESPDHTLQPTALVNEAWMRLNVDEKTQWQSRAHFLGAAAKAMHDTLIDHARKKQAQKRGGKEKPVSLSSATLVASPDNHEATDLLELEDAMQRLKENDQRMYQIVELRFFGGMTVAEIAAYLDISTRTVERNWHHARIWLLKEMRKRM